MADLIKAVTQTREITANIFAKSLVSLDGNSEAEIAKKILSEIKNHDEILSEGWYVPPPSGIAILLDERPFGRLKYGSLRNSVFWPSEASRLGKETVGLVFFSPIDRKTNMIGDIGFTLYRGDNQKIKSHLRKSYAAILEIAKYAEIGMKFSELCSFADQSFKNKFKITKWAPISSDPNQSINIGHTIPGSLGEKVAFGTYPEEIRENIRTGRIHIIDTEHFKIPETCAFTIESRLEDFSDPDLPSVYFHFIVCFNEGKKTILENFSKIFDVVGMDYMNK